jgi:hypothetical protein
MPYPETPSRSSRPPRCEVIAKPVDRQETDATGINVEERRPIDPRMPHLPPA